VVDIDLRDIATLMVGMLDDANVRGTRWGFAHCNGQGTFNAVRDMRDGAGLILKKMTILTAFR